MNQRNCFGIVTLLVFSLMLFIGCNRKSENKNNNNLQSEPIAEKKETEALSEKSDVAQASEEVEISNDESNKSVEVEKQEIYLPLSFYKKYTFLPMDEVDYNSISISSVENQNEILIYYNNEIIANINDLDFTIDSILNLFTLHLEGRLFSSAFRFTSGDNEYYGLVNFKQGVIKVYKNVLPQHFVSSPYYSGLSDYFIISDTWIKKDSYYDYKTFKTISAEYACNLLMIDFNSDEIVYSLDQKVLHDNQQLSIDKINYQNNDFQITIGSYLDSDEFVDFEIFTKDSDFHYEIYDKYTYPKDR